MGLSTFTRGISNDYQSKSLHQKSTYQIIWKSYKAYLLYRLPTMGQDSIEDDECNKILEDIQMKFDELNMKAQ